MRVARSSDSVVDERDTGSLNHNHAVISSPVDVCNFPFSCQIGGHGIRIIVTSRASNAGRVYAVLAPGAANRRLWSVDTWDFVPVSGHETQTRAANTAATAALFPFVCARAGVCDVIVGGRGRGDIRVIVRALKKKKNDEVNGE